MCYLDVMLTQYWQSLILSRIKDFIQLIYVFNIYNYSYITSSSFVNSNGGKNQAFFLIGEGLKWKNSFKKK